MGIFTKARQAYLKSEAKRASILVNVEYMGGYGDRKKALGNLSFYESQLTFRVALIPRASFLIPVSDITDLAIEGKDEVSSRVTVTRLLATGIFAFALKKKTKDKDAYLTATLKDGDEVIFHIKNKSPMELKVHLSKTLRELKSNSVIS